MADNLNILIQGDSWIREKLRTDPAGFAEYMDTFIERRFTASDTNIPRHVFLKWSSSGLLPDQADDDPGWRRFSFVEYLWLKIIQKMEEMHIPVQTMLLVKEDLFTMDIDTFVEAYKSMLDRLGGKSELLKDLPPEVLEILKGDAARIKAELTKIGAMLTPFVFLFTELMMKQKRHAVLIVGTKGVMDFICFDENLDKERLQNISLLFSESFYNVNLNELLSDFYISKKIEPEYYQNVELLTDREVEIIRAVRNTGLKELTIKFDKNEGAIIIEELTTKEAKKIEDKVKGLSKKGVATDIRIVFDHNGTLRLYQQKEQRKISSPKLKK